jgi:hypothetical protein
MKLPLNQLYNKENSMKNAKKPHNTSFIYFLFEGFLRYFSVL